MNKGVKIAQHDITDCGAACLASVSAYYGLRMPISKIRQMCCTDSRGTNVMGLLEAAGRLGFATKAVKSVNADGKCNSDRYRVYGEKCEGHRTRIYSRIEGFQDGVGELAGE